MTAMTLLGHSISAGTAVRWVLIVGGVAVFGLAMLMLKSGGGGHRGRARRGAQWASRSDLKALKARGPVPPGQIVVGRFGGSSVLSVPETSTVVVGPTRLSGKTTCVVIPAVLEHRGPLLVTSTKRDIYDATVGQRGRLGKVKVFDPMNRAGVGTATWSPVAASSTGQRAREVADQLMQVGWEDAKSDEARHWRTSGAEQLGPLLLAAHTGRRTMADIASWVYTNERDVPDELLLNCRDAWAPIAREVLGSLWLRHDNYVGSVFATLQAALYPWQEPSIAAATATEDITAEWLLSGANTLYIIGGGQDQRRLSSLYTALIMRVIDDSLALAQGRPQGRLDRPLLCALDEVANIAPIPQLDEYASTGLGQGVVLLTVLQDLSQARRLWGTRADSILSNHGTRLFMSGIGDPPTWEWISKIVGNERVERFTRQTGAGTGGTTSRAEQLEPLVPPYVMRELEAEKAMLVCGRVRPVLIELRPWFKDEELKKLAS